MTRSRVLLLSTVLNIMIMECVTLSPEDEDWIDPFDMINFDPSTVKMSGQPEKPVHQESPMDMPENKEVSKTPGGEKTHEPIKLDGEIPDIPPGNSDKLVPNSEPGIKSPPGRKVDEEKTTQRRQGAQKPAENSQVYRTLYRKHVKMLLDKWDSQAGAGNVAMVMSLSEHDLNLLRSFAETGDGHVFDINEILQKMVISVGSPHDCYGGGTFLERNVGISLSTVIQILSVLALLSVILWVELTLQVAWRQKLVKLTFLLFFISIPWTWYHMYKQEEAKRQSELTKNVPDVCMKRKLSWYEMAAEVARSAFTLSEDQCVKYYEQMLVDPIWKVPPTEAFAVTFVRFFVSPAKHIGQAVSEFVKGTFQHLPMTLWPVVLVCGMLIIILILLFSFGYSIRLPFLLSIESSHTSSYKHKLEVMASENMLQKKQIEELKSKVEQSEKILSLTGSIDLLAASRAQQEKAPALRGSLMHFQRMGSEDVCVPQQPQTSSISNHSDLPIECSRKEVSADFRSCGKNLDHSTGDHQAVKQVSQPSFHPLPDSHKTSDDGYIEDLPAERSPVKQDRNVTNDNDASLQNTQILRYLKSVSQSQQNEDTLSSLNKLSQTPVVESPQMPVIGNLDYSTGDHQAVKRVRFQSFT